MKVLVLGAGKIGSAVAWDLVKRPEVQLVGIVDNNPEALRRSTAWVNNKKIALHDLDVSGSKSETRQLMQSYDVGIITLPTRRASYSAIETAIDAKIDVVDILEEYHRRPDRLETEGLEISDGMSLDEYGEWLHNKAVKYRVTVLDGMGFEPGLSNVTTGAGIRKMDKAKTAIVRVGGIPSKETAGRHPLKYVITWAFGHVLREYMVKVNVLQGGKVIEVNAASGRESFRFTQLGRDEELEAAITPGMPSFVYTRGDLDSFVAKTIRWPGHWQGIETLIECGLLDLSPVEIKGNLSGTVKAVISIPPREFVINVLEPKLRQLDGDADSCVMWNTVTGELNGREARIDYYMWDEADVQNRISSMARVTGFTAASAAVLLGTGKIKQEGIVAPEDGIFGEAYEILLAELQERNVRILETAPQYLDGK